MIEWTDALIAYPRPASPAAVRAAEAELGFRLPPDFLAVALVYQGARPVPAHLTVPGWGATDVAHLLHFEDHPGHTNIAARRFPLADAMEDNVIPFAADSGDDLFCFDYRRDPAHPSVVFWSVDSGPLLLADSFTAFLALLHPDV